MANAHCETVVVGAGIFGLDVALVLAEKGFGSSVSVVAEYLPGDTAPDYTSPWFVISASACAFVDPTVLTSVSEPVLPAEKLPRGTKFGVSFTTFTINAPKHIEYLYHRLKHQYGVSFTRQKLPNIQAAFSDPSIKRVFNCTGNAARTLPGVQDTACYPTRGQVVLAKASNVQTNMMRHGRDYETYIIPRPHSNGNVVLGGFMQKGNSDVATYSHDTRDILGRTRQLIPELYESKLDVIAAFAGLCPSRVGGARVERTTATVSRSKRPIIHNYGAGGTGFQAGYGMAVEAVGLAQDILREFQAGHRARS
ncbi:d-amino-acid oxidase [Stemphylium lycopersici]|uniref:D-amino-acid oxidase n=1 Tax=Stemphylium lycopersici TaxID=183478 RepID=A0A364MRL9_STELY|nr:d-amino-acid oxidase [Stemphylium lycopersici]RAQ98709.1 d-amino-acid oxidase [Stemphylium lycopersici]RAQ99828.1 d-amino-acid oxidase [Stemphylium lycopersici]